MSGRVKQRTKGNTKPSSSGRAAELLSREGLMGFVGFGDAGTSSDGSSLQFVPASTELPDASVHSDFLVVMKKLSKRDAVTKLKAVQEFGELCKTSDMKAVLGVLKYWPRLYNKLSLDIDYRVREATQHAMNQMTSRVGRNFAPHLKSVMGVWLCSQCDTYLPVATSAQKAFNTAFSENKQAEVLDFCKKEVNEHLVDNVLNQTADTLSDPDVDEKDRGAKHVRVIAASLQALGKFLKMVDADVSSLIVHYHTRLTAEKKFWKLGRHKSPQIRAAFFSLISTYCQKQPSIVESCASSVCPIVLGSLDEADAIVSSPLWEAVLLVVSRLKDCWEHVNMEKAVLPKFWQFLSNAGYGSAQVVMISVLPFISTLPDEVVSPSSRFAQKVLGKIVDGLKLVKTQQSPSECKAVLSSFIDCVKYFTSLGSKQWKMDIDHNDIQQIRSDVIIVLINVLEMSLAPKTQMRQSCSLLYERLAEFLRETADREDIQDPFWSAFDQLIQNKVQHSEKDIAATFQLIVNILSCLKSKQTLQESQPSKVRFHEPSDSQCIKPEIKTKRQTKPTDVDVTLIYGGRLLAVVSKTVCSCLERVWSENSETDLVLVTELVKDFFCASLLNDVLSKDITITAGSVDETQPSEVYRRCVDELIVPLLDKDRQKTDEKWLSCSVRLFFLLLVEVQESEQKCAVERIFQASSSPALLYFIVNEIFDAELYLYLSHLHGIQIGVRLIEVLRDSECCFCDETDLGLERYLWKTLDLCFVRSHLQEFFFNDSALREIFHSFHLVLSQENVVSSNRISVLQLIEKYVQNNEVSFSQYEALLNEVFMDIVQLKLRSQEQDHVSQCWNSLVNSAISNKSWFDYVISQTAQQIKEFFFHNDVPVTFEKFSVFADSAVEILDSLIKDDYEHFRKVLKELSPSDSKWGDLRADSLLQSAWAVASFLDGTLAFCQFPTTSLYNDPEQLSTHQTSCLLLSHILKQRSSTCFRDTEDDQYELKILAELLWLREFFKQTSITKGGRFATLLAVLDRNLQPLLKAITQTSESPLLSLLRALSESEGGLWSLTMKSVLTDALKDEDISCVEVDLVSCERSEYTEQKLHTLQSLLAVEKTIYNLKIIVENYSKMLRETDASDVTGQMFRHCVLSSALQRWIDLSQDFEMASLECWVTLLDVLKDLRTRQAAMTDLLLLSCSLDSVPVSQISLNIAIIRIMTLAIRYFSKNLDSELWDMVLCSMLDWLQSCQESNIVNIHVSAMTNSVCHLVEVVAKNLCAGDLHTAESGADAASSDDVVGVALMKKLADEWREFFSVSACGNLLRLWTQIADTDITDNQRLFVSHHRLSETLSAACCYLTTDNLKEYITSNIAQESKLTWEQDFVGKYSPYLESNFCSFQLAAYRLMLKVIPTLSPLKESEGEASGKDNDDPCRSPPTKLVGLISRNQAKLSHILSEAQVPFGETLGMENDLEASHITRSYLLSWKLLLAHFSFSNEEVRAEYANFLRRERYLNELLGILFRLLPKKPCEKRSLVEESSLEEKYLLREEFVHDLAFETYYDLLRTLPALVRQWWNNLEKKHAVVVEKYTICYISPLLCDKEMQTVQKATSTHDNMVVVTRSSTREVIAYYKIEDISIELIVSLSSSYPLGLINVTSGKRVGVKLNQWRLWMMQLTTFLMHQNGSILDGLLLWKRNVDKKFEGVDDCMICFSVIHGSNYSLPRLSCKTCKKKFHSACLYRWFSTSNNSTCPLCRNLF